MPRAAKTATTEKKEKKELLRCSVCKEIRMRLVECPAHDDRYECDQCITGCEELEQWGAALNNLGNEEHIKLKTIIQKDITE